MLITDIHLPLKLYNGYVIFVTCNIILVNIPPISITNCANYLFFLCIIDDSGIMNYLPLAAQVVDGMPGSDCHIVIKAKAMWLVWLGMVAGRSY